MPGHGVHNPARMESRHSPRGAAPLIYGGAAACIIAIHLATDGTLGFHIDELYYLASGRHLALGYVDYPPIVPLLARLETGLLGTTPWTLRVLPALVGGVNVMLWGAYVRKLGGSLRLQALALLIAITAPLVLGTWLFQTVIFDQWAWMLSLYWFLGLIIDHKPRNWILMGITLGIGLEIKYLILPLVLGIVIAVLLTPSLRRDLRTRYPWIGGALMLLIWLPNVVWQIANGFPTVTYVLNHQGDIRSGGGVFDFLLLFLVLLFLLAPVWVAGFVSLFRNPALRAIGIACATPMVVYLFVGKFYYPSPTIAIVMAAGLLALSRVERRTLRSNSDRCGRCCECSGWHRPPEDHRPDHARRPIARNRPRYPEHGLRIHGRLGVDHRSDDSGVCRALSVRTGHDGHRLVGLRRCRSAADLRRFKAPSGKLQSSAERLLLASTAPWRD